jgi:hypothetical protein
MKKIGKIGRANMAANKKIDEYFVENGIQSCEIRLQGCTGAYWLTRCHKEKREAYRSNLERLGDPKEVLLGCCSCHERLDDRSKTTKEQADAIYLRQRPNENSA